MVMYFGKKMFMAESLGVDCSVCSAHGVRRRLTWWLSNGIDFDLVTAAINRSLRRNRVLR